jgi:hypothetical protein
MPMCGFNPAMLDGLRKFGEGLWQQAEARAQADSLTLLESITQEIAEMDIFLRILAGKDDLKYQAVVGAAHLAQALYRNARGAENPRESFRQGLEEAIALFMAIDRKYYDELRPNTAPKQALKQLGQWLQ